MQDLQSITDAWGQWLAKKHNTKCRYTESTNYKKQSSLDQYRDKQCTVTPQSIVYDTNSPPTSGADVVYGLWYSNDTTAEQTNIFKYSEEHTSSFNWTITEKLSVGVEVSVTAGVPEVATASAKTSVNLSLSSTQGATWTETKTWEVHSPVHVPANSVVRVDMAINTQSYDINFTESVLLAGRVAIWFEDKRELGTSGPHWLYFMRIQDVSNDVIRYNLANTRGYQVTGAGVLATARGVFQGEQGISVGVTATQLPPTTKGIAAQPRSLNQVELYPSVLAAAE